MLHADTNFLRTHGVGMPGETGCSFHGEIQIDHTRFYIDSLTFRDMGVEQLTTAQKLLTNILFAVFCDSLRHIFTNNLICYFNIRTGCCFNGIVATGDIVVITAGVPIGKTGSTNLIKAQVVK